MFSKEVFENGTKIHYNRRREDRKTVSWIPSIGASGVRKRKELEKRQIIRSLWLAISKGNSKFGFDPKKNPGTDLGKTDPKILPLEVKQEP